MELSPAGPWALAAILSLATATPALADAACDTVTFPRATSESLRLARVRPGANAGFLDGHAGCPGPSPACRRTEYVVPGDVLIAGAIRDAYVCAYYGSRTSETAGWLPASRLQLLDRARLPAAAWLGVWHYGDSTITIRPAGRALAVSAHAYWPSRTDPNGHEGRLDARSEPSGGDVSLADPDDPQGCKLALSLLGGYLVARDNDACGGANVTMSGIYRK